jgi:hypothetical protein
VTIMRGTHLIRGAGICGARWYGCFGYGRLMASFIVFIALVLVGGVGFGADPKETVKKEPQTVQKPFDISDFVYSADKRRDPFQPAAMLKALEAKETKASRRGYELEELRLVGVLKSGKVSYAMMEDMQRKGLFFKKGDFLNSNLWVLDVLESKVVLGYKLKGVVRNVVLDIPRK